ncbi:MAG: hypothetical protein AM326_11340 [Candidatus Thorarchaeota archaeon SMTZ-45]|nr:MAG: hypothetical protein AM326_11340 [Candidatus Thorarchaeota archaeon SMTZ-45]KXH73398.1 MAG: hypothetical protein AM325_07715 [Candidatus Thorarchaeota archaeon SMTZ1-45]
MDENQPEQVRNRVIESIKTQRAILVRRVAIILLLLYFAVMVDVGSYVYGTVDHGFYFTYLGYDIFPIPYQWAVLLPVITELDPLRSFIFFTFIGQGIWIVWALLGIIYIVMPLVHWAYNIKREPDSEIMQVRSDKVEKIGVITGIVAVLSVYLSVVTFRINLVNYGLLPLVLVSSLSIVVICFLVIEILNMIRNKTRKIPVT